MALGGFGGINQANHAAILQLQIRDQLGIPRQGLGLGGPKRPQAALPEDPLLRSQVADQRQAQAIFREIELETRAVRTTAKQSPSQNIAPQRALGLNFNQMGQFLNLLMHTMMSFAQLGNGFSSFMGGEPVHPHYEYK